MSLLEKGIEKGLIKFDEGRKNIIYLEINLKKDFTTPEEPVRANAYLELIFVYGYKPQFIDLEVKAKQGSSGKTSADIVVYEENSKKGFLVVETKKANSSEKEDEIRKQARSYSKTEEINCQLYAYKIGDNPFVAFKTNGKDLETKIPYRYTQSCVYAYIVEGKPVPEEQLHFEALKPSTPHELKRIFKQCHDVIWESGKLNKTKALEEFNKMLFLKMFDEIEREKAERHLQEYIFQTRTLETKLQLRNRIVSEFDNAIIKRKVDDLLKSIVIDEYQIFYVIEKLQGISLIKTDKDPKGLAFETYTEAHMKGEFGQFFTPRNIVDFMVKTSPISWQDDFNSNSKLLDPTCGSGSFLTHAMSSFRNRFQNPKNWQDFANNSVFGIELNDDISISAKVNFALHDDGHDNIKNANGLNLKHLDWKNKQYDLILTNPPFGGEIKNLSAEQDKAHEDMTKFYDYEEFYLTQKQIDEIDAIRGKVKTTIKFSDRIKPEHIFIELYYKALNEGGIVQVILPDGVLTNSSTQNVRDYIGTHFQILAVISLPQYTFTHYGAGVKTSILYLKKLPLKTTLSIEAQKRKYLSAEVKNLEPKLKTLEKRKASIENEHESIMKIKQWQKHQAEVIEKSQLFADKSFAKKELDTLQKDAEKKIKEIKATEDFKEWKRNADAELNDEIKAIYEQIYENAQETYKRLETEQNYPIFMVIAENIGYDATGRETPQNDLDAIVAELNRFLKHQHETPKGFFALALQ